MKVVVHEVTLNRLLVLTQPYPDLLLLPGGSLKQLSVCLEASRLSNLHTDLVPQLFYVSSKLAAAEGEVVQVVGISNGMLRTRSCLSGIRFL